MMITCEEFIGAAQNNRLDIIRAYLSQPDANIECRGYLNMTALLHAARNGHLDIVSYLIENGADIHSAGYPEGQSGTALEMAAETGHIDMVDTLLDAEANVNNPITGKSSALLSAAMGGHLEIVSRLIDQGANVTTTTGDKTTVLILISGLGPNHAKNPDPEFLKNCMQKIMDAGVEVNAEDNLRNCALSRAVNANNEITVEFLLKSGADPDLAAAALPISQLVRYQKCLKLLIDYGLKNTFFFKAISTALLNGQTGSARSMASALPGDLKSLHMSGVQFVEGCATRDLKQFDAHVRENGTPDTISLYGGIAISATMSRYGNLDEKIRILLNAGAAANPDLGYQNPILKAARSGNVDIIKLLIDHGANPNPESDESVTPLMIVLGVERLYDDRSRPARSFDESVDKKVRLLLDAGADVNARGPEGLTPLAIAIQQYPFNIQTLLTAGADVNCISKFGWTPLMSASPRITRQLLDAGADIHLQNTDGRTALFLCTRPTKADALRKAGADPAKRDRTGMTPLMYHASMGNAKMVKWFGRYKKNINAVDNNGKNAVMHTYGDNWLEIITFLKELGEDLTIINHEKETWLIRACRISNPEMIRLALTLDIDINAVNAKGETALMTACHSHDNGSTAKLLLKHGADPFIKNPAGQTALDIARQFKPADALTELETMIREMSFKS